MADSARIQMAPLVGFDNILTIEDGGVTKPMVFDDNATIALLTDGGDGSLGSFDVKVPPKGRKGSMKTILQLIPIEDFGDGDDAEFRVMVQIPNGLQGIVDPSLSASEAATAKIDPSLWLPVVTLTRCITPYKDSEEWPEGEDSISITAGVNKYTPAAEVEADLGNVGENGYLTILCLLEVPSSAEIHEGLNLQLVVDFSHSTGN